MDYKQLDMQVMQLQGLMIKSAYIKKKNSIFLLSNE